MLTKRVAKYVVAIAVIGFFYTVGPSLDYYVHLALGQMRLLLDARPIPEILAENQLDPRKKARLSFVAAVREFGQQTMGLSVDDQYTCFYDAGGRPVSWNLSASLPDRLEAHIWNFPIVGAVPYKGFFDLERAQRERNQLESNGYDVWLSPVSAYSTLGFFADPVLSTMLNYSDDGLATLLLHELTHSTVYAPSQTDFNESLATFVGKEGSLIFLTELFGDSSRQILEARQRRLDAKAFHGFVRKLVTDLDSLYNSGMSREQILIERVSVMDRAKADYLSVRETLLLSPGAYDGFLDWRVNNARFLSFKRYHDLDDFKALFSACEGDMRHFVRLSQSCAQTQVPRSCLQDTTAKLKNGI
jgi:predicted aminopeptidase